MQKAYLNGIFNTTKLKWTMRDHPSRESDFIVDEFLWESETRKILDELRYTSKKALIEKSIFVNSSYNNIEKINSF